MKPQKSLFQALVPVGIVTVLLLMVPLIAMQFTSDVDWSITDFIIMGVLIFGTGGAYVLLTRTVGNLVYRAAIGLALGTGFFMVWANLAVGLIGSGPHFANLLYIAVLATGIIGAIVSGFKPTGMERTMYATAFALAVVAVVALLANVHEYPGSSVREILLVNGFFAALFTFAGLLFRVAQQRTTT